MANFFFLVSSLLPFLLFPIRGTCAEGNSKNGSSEDTNKNIFRDRKKYKNDKTKNVSSVVIAFFQSLFCIFVFPTFVSNALFAGVESMRFFFYNKIKGRKDIDVNDCCRAGMDTDNTNIQYNVGKIKSIKNYKML